MKSRTSIAGLLAAMLLGVGAAGTFALTGEFSSDEDTARTQYGPGQGCDNSNRQKNHDGEHPCRRSCEETPRNGSNGNGDDKGNRRRNGNNGEPPHCRVEGTDANDSARSKSGPETFDMGAGSDVVDARGGGRDTVNCGSGRDTVYADKNDRVNRDCERVTTSKSNDGPRRR